MYASGSQLRIVRRLSRLAKFFHGVAKMPGYHVAPARVVPVHGFLRFKTRRPGPVHRLQENLPGFTVVTFAKQTFPFRAKTLDPGGNAVG